MIIDSPLNCSDNISLWKGNDKMTCSSCQFLNETRKKDGAVSGAIYFCAKKNKYVYGYDNKCESYEKTYSRYSLNCSTIYEDGQNYYNDTKSTSFYLTILIILIIIGLLINIF